MYDAYDINEDLFSNSVLLFVRESKSEEGVTSPYTYLGHADIVKYSGSKSINIIWELRNKLPANIAVKAENAL